MIKGTEYTAGANRSLLPNGLFDTTPVAVNPDKEELIKLGINANNEPRYTLTDGDDNEIGTRLAVYLKYEFKDGDKSYTFIDPTFINLYKDFRKQADSGRIKYINNQVDSIYAMDEAEINERNEKALEKGYGYFDTSNYKKERIGEQQLYQFIYTLARIKKDKNMVFDMLSDKEWEKLSGGDISKIKKEISKLAKNQIRLLRGINRENNRGAWFDKNSAIGQNPYLYAGQNVTENGPFFRFVFDKKRKGDEPGEYSWAEQYYFNAIPNLYEVKLPDLTKTVSGKAEEVSVDDYPF